MPAWSRPPPIHCSLSLTTSWISPRLRPGNSNSKALISSCEAASSRTLKTLALRAHQKGLELNCSIEADVPDALLGDPTRLRQILINLLGNSLEIHRQRRNQPGGQKGVRR